MIGLFTPEQVRGMDARAFSRGVSSAALMERAGGHLARGIVATGGHGYGLRVGILAGKGNNGGDGLAAARRLLDAGASPRVCLVAGEFTLADDASAQLRRYRAAGGRLARSIGEALAGADVVVDCLLGTGASGEPREPYRSAIEELNRCARYTAGLAVVACDAPSGVDADSGAVPAEAVRADLTVTLGAHKRGLHLWPARGYCGRLVLGELGIVEAGDDPVARVLEPADVADLLPPLDAGAHKRSSGVVVVVAGSSGMSGAATLTARGAMAAGAGLVTVATSAAARPLVAPTVPEALTVALPDDPDAAFTQLAELAGRADALAVGPGLGHDGPVVELVRRLVAEVDVPLVLDADGLNAFRHEGRLLARHACPLLVLTPHEQEFTRLLADPPGYTPYGASPPPREGAWQQRASLVPDKAAEWDAVIAAKGPGTLTSAPDGRVWVNATGGAALATAGSGDVLTGMTAALVARRPAAEVVAAAVALHGLAGERAEPGAERSVTALDVAAAVPAVLADLQTAR